MENFPENYYLFTANNVSLFFNATLIDRMMKYSSTRLVRAVCVYLSSIPVDISVLCSTHTTHVHVTVHNFQSNKKYLLQIS